MVGDPAVLAAALLASLPRARAFAHGNKQTAFLCAVALIEANGWAFTMPDSEAGAERLLDFLEHRRGESAAAEWLRYWIERR